MESEVHVTVGVVRYDIEGRARGWGIKLLADRVEEEGEVRVFIEHNDNFRLPANPETPVIAIGRAPASRRSAPLCSSVPRTTRRVKLAVLRQPALYRRFPLPVEWQRYVKEGVLTRIDLAGPAIRKKSIRTRQTARTGRRAVALDQ